MDGNANISIMSNIYPIQSKEALENKNVTKDEDFRKQVCGKAALKKLVEWSGKNIDVSNYDESCKKALLGLNIPRQRVELFWDLGAYCSRADNKKKHYGLVVRNGTCKIVCRCEKTLCEHRQEKECRNCKLHG